MYIVGGVKVTADFGVNFKEAEFIHLLKATLNHAVAGRNHTVSAMTHVHSLIQIILSSVRYIWSMDNPYAMTSICFMERYVGWSGVGVLFQTLYWSA